MNTDWADETLSYVTDNTGNSSVAFSSFGTLNNFGMSLDNVSVTGPALDACPPPPGECPDCTTNPDAVGCNTCSSSSSSASSEGASTLGSYDSGWSVLFGANGPKTNKDKDKDGGTTPECGLCFVDGIKGKITQLTLLYDGDDFTSHAQAADKSSVVPDNVTNLPINANIKVVDEDKGTVLFEGSVGKADTFSFAPVNALLITIKDGSTVVQTIRFHASCSQPLQRQDTFGGITIWDGVTVKK